MSGKLYVVSTPIGNLEDITLRAIRTLKEVDRIACEDTRVTKKLLSHYQIQKPLTSYHEHNEKEKAQELLALLELGQNIALVSDAGTPGVSDPGYRLIRLASERGVEIIPIPGASAAVAALSVSGLSTSSFAFFGFLPKQAKKRKEFLEGIREYPETLVFYESPNRILETLGSVFEALGDRRVSVSRELTKMFEETLRGNVSSVTRILEERKGIKGEFTIVVEGMSDEEKVISSETVEEQLRACKEMGLSLKDSVKEVSKSSKTSRSEVYREALRIWGKV